MPALGKAREKANQASCINQLKQFSLACSIYRSDFRDRFPYWLSTLYPDYVPTQKLYRCPMDKKFDGDPHPYDTSSNTAAFLYDKEGTASADSSGKPNFGTSKKKNLTSKGISYLYQMSNAPASKANDSWFGWEDHYNIKYSDFHDYSEVKEYQQENGDKNNGYNAYDPTVFPIISCFWHAKKNKEGKDSGHNAPALQIAYSGNFFMSKVQWEYGQWQP